MTTFDKDITLQDLFTLLGEKIYMYSELTRLLEQNEQEQKEIFKLIQEKTHGNGKNLATDK